MIVKDLQKYIKVLTGGKLAETLGSVSDPLLSFLAGETSDLENQHIKLLTDFATESNTQIFYELLQNAEDEKANQVFFYFDDDNFVVINNGLPFYTDSKDTQLDRDGQLRGFLARGRGGKSNNPNKIGEKGLGSKLLYDLMANTGIGTKEGLIQSLIEDTKGLILFSWSNLRQWEQFVLSNPNQFNFKGEPSDDSIALLTKIVYAYYPANLNEKQQTIRGEKLLFSEGELQACISYLNVVKTELPQTALNQGTLIYIPLGKGKAQKLKAVLDQEIISGISGSMAFLENIKNTTINKLRIKNFDFKKVDLPVIKRGKEKSTVTLAFPLAPLSIDYKFVNFYKFLPITTTYFGLNFIINTKAYEIDSSRQHIKLDESNQNILIEISGNISSYIKSISNNTEKGIYLALMKCIIFTDVEKLKAHKDIYKTYFYDNLIETIKTNIPTTTGFSTNINEVRIKNTALDFSPQDLGVSWQWLDTDFADNRYGKVKTVLGIVEATVFDVLNNAKTNNTPKIIDWVKHLSKEEYAILVDEITSQNTYSQRNTIPFVRCSDGRVCSTHEIDTSLDIVFLTAEMQGLKPVFDKLLIKYSDVNVGELPQLTKAKNIEKIITLINNSSITERDDKWTVFDVFKSINQVPKLKIFENQLGEKYLLERLLHNSSNFVSSGVLKRFAIKPCEIDGYRNMNAFMMKPENVWESLIDNWNLHITKDLDYTAPIKDLNILYNKRLITNTTRKPENTHAWIRTDTGEWAKSSEIFFCTPLSNLLENEYNLLVSVVKRGTDLKTIPFQDIQLFETVKFSEKPSFNFKDLKEWFNDDSIIVTKRELEVLLKIKNGDSLLSSFVVKNAENIDYQLVIKQKGSKQYISRDRELNAFLATTEYHLLPNALESLFSDDISLLRENENFALDLISAFRGERALINLVNRQGKTVKENYLQKITSIEFNTESTVESYKDTFEGTIIEMAVELEKVEDIRKKIQIDSKSLEFYAIRRENVSVKISESQKIEFNLSQLLSEFEGKTDKLAIIREKMSTVKKGKVFDAKPFPLKEIEEKLLQMPLNDAEQFTFLIAFYKSTEGAEFKNRFSKFVYTQLNELDVLQSLTNDNRNLYFYSDFILPSNWFNPKIYIDTVDENLILDSEKIPLYISRWISSNAERKGFFYKAGLINEQSDVITLRKGVFRDERVEDTTIKGCLSRDSFIQNTFTWIIQKEKEQTFSRSSGKYKNILALVKEFILAKQCLSPLLIATRDLDNYLILPSFNPKYLLYINPFDIEKEKDIFVDTLKKHTTLNVITNNGFKEVLEKNGIKELKFSSEFCSDTGDFKEWCDDFYREWKKSDGEKYRIYW